MFTAMPQSQCELYLLEQLHRYPIAHRLDIIVDACVIFLALSSLGPLVHPDKGSSSREGGVHATAPKKMYLPVPASRFLER